MKRLSNAQVRILGQIVRRQDEGYHHGLDLRDGWVTRTTDALKRRGLVEQVPFKGLRATAKGREALAAAEAKS